MSSKIVRLALTWPHTSIAWEQGREERYRIAKVVNSVRYVPGQYLAKQEVEQLCDSKLYDVTITRNIGS